MGEAPRSLTTNNTKEVIHIPATAIVSEVGSQLANAYRKTQSEFVGNPTKMNNTWDEVCDQLSRFDPTSPNPNNLAEAHAYLSILEQILVASSTSATST